MPKSQLQKADTTQRPKRRDTKPRTHTQPKPSSQPACRATSTAPRSRPHRASCTRVRTFSQATARTSRPRCEADSAAPCRPARFRSPRRAPTDPTRTPRCAAGEFWSGELLRGVGRDELRHGGHQPHPRLRRAPLRRRPRHLGGEGAALARPGAGRAPDDEAEPAARLVRSLAGATSQPD